MDSKGVNRRVGGNQPSDFQLRIAFVLAGWLRSLQKKQEKNDPGCSN